MYVEKSTKVAIPETAKYGTIFSKFKDLISDKILHNLLNNSPSKPFVIILNYNSTFVDILPY